MTDILRRNNVNITGDGEKVMIFAHGFGCDQNVWTYLVNAFSSDYKLVLFDYVGAGKSEISAYNSQRYGTLEGYAEDLLDVCEALKISGAIFIGHSVSSIIGLLAANKEPSYFEKLVFIGPSPCYMNNEGYVGGFERENLEQLFDMMDSNYLGWSRSMAPVIMGNPDRPELSNELIHNFCATDPKIASEFARVTFLSDNRSDLAKLRLPSLTLQCREDIIAPLAVGYYMEQNIPGNSLVVMDATGHCPHMSAPEETVKAIKAYLS